MNTYLRILAVFYLYGALVHLADLLSLGHHLGQTHGLAFPEMSLPWQIGTVGFAAVDLVAAAGLWLRAWWGVMAFLAAAVAQIVMYRSIPRPSAIIQVWSVSTSRPSRSMASC
ncbi:MAG: DUF6163 family protein [Mesorhizobium sp.]